MNKLQLAGGIAAFVEAGTYLLGMVVLFAVLMPAGYQPGAGDAGTTVTVMADNHLMLVLWNGLIYLVNGAFLVVLAVALHDRMKSDAPGLSLTALGFGLIWAGLVLASGMVTNVGINAVVTLHGSDPAGAAALWQPVALVANGLGGGNELVGGIWVVLISLAALRSAALPRLLNVLGIIIGIAGAVTIIPGLGEVGAVFGLGFIVWFIWTGLVLIRRR